MGSDFWTFVINLLVAGIAIGIGFVIFIYEHSYMVLTMPIILSICLIRSEIHKVKILMKQRESV